MLNNSQIKPRSIWAVVIAPLFLVIWLTGCLSDSSSDSTPAVVVAGGGSVAPSGITQIEFPITNPINKFTNVGGVTVESVNTLAPGDSVVISGTTNYNGTFTVATATANSFTIAAPFVVEPDGTGTWTAGGGVNAGCLTAGSGVALPLMSAVASRFTGVAPLSVFFDATATTGAVVQPFHELQYTWSFGDPAGGATWAHGTGHNNSKNAASGPVAAHVFETPGTYTVTLTVTDGTDTVTNACMQIAVQNPSVVYAGTATRCYSRTGSFAGCPAGATQITDAAGDFTAAVAAGLSTGRRLLFNRGETWFTSNQAFLNVDGPWTIGAYGVGAKPIIQWTGGSVILGWAQNNSNLFNDARVMDLVLDGTSPGAPLPGPPLVGAMDFYGTFKQITLLRIECIRVNVCISQSSTKANLAAPWDEFTVVDSFLNPTQGGSGGNGMFLLSSRTAIMGNLFDNNFVGEHNFRSMYWNGLVISSNTFQKPNSTKANLTLRGPSFLSGSGGNIPPGTFSQYGVISDNKFVGGVGIQVPVNTSIDASVADRSRYVIFERNWWTNQVETVAALGLDSSFSAVRNNIIDMSANTLVGGFQALTVTDNAHNDLINGPSPATDNVIYNNTIYANTAVPSPVRGIRLFNGSFNTTVKNNLVYAPSATTVEVVFTAGAPGVTGTVGDVDGTFGNSSNAQAKLSNPSFASGSPTVPADFKITGGYALGTGVPVPVWSDILGVTNVAPWDRGAVRH